MVCRRSTDVEVAYATRKQQLLHECHVAPEIFPQVMPRLETFLAPFVRPFCRQEPAHHAHTYVYGRLGKVDNGQVAVYLGYVSGEGHTLVDMRLSLPKTWTQDKTRLDKAGVPRDRRGYRSRHQWALDMLEQNG